MKGEKLNKIKYFLTAFIVLLLLTTTLVNPITAKESSKVYTEGFEKGVTYQPFIPIKKAILVNFDKDTLIDDYAYLASIPASVFSNENTIYANPLLLFQADKTYPDEEKYRFLNDYSGTHYLMEDWMGYSNGQMDKLTTINVKQAELDPSWKAKTTTEIKGNNVFKIASEIAEDEWSYSDEAVIAVIEENYEKPDHTRTIGTIDGQIQGNIGTDSLKIKRPHGPASEYGYFSIEEEYKYVEVDLWYPAIVKKSPILNMIPGFAGAVGITLPSVDPDLQIFCKYENDWLQTAAAAEMAITKGPHESCFSYVYEPGEWRVGVTNMPTEGGDDKYFINEKGLIGLGRYEVYGDFKDAVKNLIYGVDEFNVDVTKYPGVEEIIPDVPPFGCRNADFTLSWNDDKTTLGLTIIGPSGEELESVMEKDVDKQEIHFDMLGECLEGENYRVVVYALNDISRPINYKLEYSWQQNITRKEADLLASACQGAILGSITNNPLLYVTPKNIPECTEETILKLGVKKINIVDLGGYLSKENKDKLSNLVDIKNHYTEYKNIYDDILFKTSSNSIVFSTIDPWSYWYYESNHNELKPNGKYEGAFYFGPASYAAAIHGTPLLLVDNHPELSGAVTWHREFWRKNANGFNLPPVSCMFLTGSKVQKFLREYGFDKEGHESILTVAGQYNIGPTWTRVFAGVASPGAIIGTPVDTTNHIARCLFYPGLIFENPALKGTVELETGSISERVRSDILHPLKGLIARLGLKTPGLSNLKIIKPSQVETFEYPVLHTYGCYNHRFNERASEYWGIKYQTRNGNIPGETISGLEIDMGTREIFEGKPGSFLPDMSTSVIGPFYCEKAGYSNAFSTNYDVTIKNLNQGVISWYMVLHGMSFEGGQLAWWQPVSETLESVGIPSRTANLINKVLGVPLGLNPNEENPWRGYDMLWGSTEEPDSALLNSEIGLLTGWFNPFFDPLGRGILKTGLDVVPTHRAGYYDGLIGPYSITAMIAKFAYTHPATEIDDDLGNLHSMNFHAGSCLIACNYLQIALMRHGSVLQEMDPWPTSYWAGYVGQQVAKDYALGKSAGEAYSEAITEIGIKYLFEEDEKRVWWWDTAENMVLFTDPDLHVWVASDEYDPEARNHWDKKDFQSLRFDSESDISGHMPFGATSYPNQRKPTSFLEENILFILVVCLILILVVYLALFSRKKQKNKKK
jgi:hypothetical protein